MPESQLRAHSNVCESIYFQGNCAFQRAYSSSLSPRVVVIAGSTSTGKSKIAAKVAKELNGELISVDSIKVSSFAQSCGSCLDI